MLGSPILHLKGMRLMMFQLSSFYCIRDRFCGFLYCLYQGSVTDRRALRGFHEGAVRDRVLNGHLSASKKGFFEGSVRILWVSVQVLKKDFVARV